MTACSPDDELHMVKKDRVCLVLRNRQQVEVALNEYHNELNHLNVNKCLRLLHERSEVTYSPKASDTPRSVNK